MDGKTPLMASVVAIILAASGLAYTFMATEANRQGNSQLSQSLAELQNALNSLESRLNVLNSSLVQLSSDLSYDIASMKGNITNLLTQISTIQTEMANLQFSVTALEAVVGSLESQISNLQTRIATLESQRAVVVRIWFLRFEPDRVPQVGKDYLFDVKVRWGSGIEDYVYGRTGHSRFVAPNYLDLSLKRELLGSDVQITIFAYWHADDYPIDIDPDPAHGRVIFTPNSCSGASLTLWYTIGGPALQGSVDGNNDGFLLDLYDAIFEYKIETLQQ